MTSTNNSTRVKASANFELSSNHAPIERANDGDVLNRVRRMSLDRGEVSSPHMQSCRVETRMHNPQILHVSQISFNSNIVILENNLGNGSIKHISRCKSKVCKMREEFVCRDKTASTVTHRIYDCIIPPGSSALNCHSQNVIYLITCDKCHLQYVGETLQPLNKRFNWHRSCLRYPNKYGHCKRLTEHFLQGECQDSTYSVQIIEKIEGDGRTPRGAIDLNVSGLRKQKEKEWMLKMRTVFPYGLNDRVGDEHSSFRSKNFIGSLFPPLKRSAPHCIRGQNRKGMNRFNADNLLHILQFQLDNNLPNAMNNLRILLSSMKKSELKILSDKLNDHVSSQRDDNFSFSQWYLAALDFIESKLFKPVPVKPKRKKPENVCKIYFHNKALDFINLSHILNDSELEGTIPMDARDFPIPTVVYNLPPPIRSKIFNFNKFIEDLDLNQFLMDNNTVPCVCENSEFKDERLGHILTGNLSIVKNNALRKLLTKGPKYREPRNINFQKARDNIVSGLQDCIDKWCHKKGLPPHVLSDWRNTVLELVDKRILILKNTLKHQHTREVLKDEEVKSCLADLHSKFVITPIDKANGNVAFICRRYYVSTIVKELGLGDNSISNTYCMVPSNQAPEIMRKNIEDMKNLFNMDVGEDQHMLPHMYWLPKLHKNPPKPRFIIAAPNCTVKKLSKALTCILKLFFHQIKRYSQVCQHFSGVNTFWVIENNIPVLDCLKKLSSRHKARSINTFDFSTLYTKIPHDKLIYVMNELVDFCFRGGDKQYIAVNFGRAFWVDTLHQHQIVFTKQKVKDALEYLMSNCYFTVGSHVFRQIIGIPMGSDPAPFMANLFLYFYENKFILEIKKTDIARAKRFSYVFRFIDDLNSLNDWDEFLNSHKDIYPPELELGKENDDPSQASFLDLDIKVEDGQFIYSQYDKRDSFPFSIVRLPYKCSNIPSNMFYSSIVAEVLRIGRTSFSAAVFLRRVKTLIQRMIKQGALAEELKKYLKRTFNRHSEDLCHITDDTGIFMKMVLG